MRSSIDKLARFTGVLLLAGLPLAGACKQPKTFVVDTPVDAKDVLPGDGRCETPSGACSLPPAVVAPIGWR